jgi:hypothetical protein
MKVCRCLLPPYRSNKKIDMVDLTITKGNKQWFGDIYSNENNSYGGIN